MNGISRMTIGLAAVIFLLAAAPAAPQYIYHEEDKWEERHNRAQPPEKVMDAIGVTAGMTVAEIGAGRGRYAVRMAERVGAEGKVYANDISASDLAYLRERCGRDGIGNLKTVLGEVTDPGLPEGAIDLVYVINSYHHFEDPVELLRNALPCLGPGGRLVIIEHDYDKYGDKAGRHCRPQNEIIDQAYRAGFYLIGIETFLEKDNINIFIPRSRVKDL